MKYLKFIFFVWIILPKPIVEHFYEHVWNFVITRFAPALDVNWKMYTIHYLPTYLSTVPTPNIILYYFRFQSSKKGHKKAKIDISLLYSIPFVCCVNAPRKIYFPILLSIFYRPIADTLSICHTAVCVHVIYIDMYIAFCFLLKTHWEFYWSLDEDMYDAAEVRIDGNEIYKPESESDEIYFMNWLYNRWTNSGSN